MRERGLGIRSPIYLAGPARIAALINWYTHAEDDLQIQGVHKARFADMQILTTQIAAKGYKKTNPQLSPHRIRQHNDGGPTHGPKTTEGS